MGKKEESADEFKKHEKREEEGLGKLKKGRECMTRRWETGRRNRL